LASLNLPCGSKRLNERILTRSHHSSDTSAQATPIVPMSLLEMEKQLTCSVLQHTGGSRTRDAEILGISREGLRTKLHRLQMRSDSDLLS
jgi:DNA-binding protein Fis